jgi:hypothetical protein
MAYQVVVAVLWRTKCEIPAETQNTIKYKLSNTYYNSGMSFIMHTLKRLSKTS